MRDLTVQLQALVRVVAGEHQLTLSQALILMSVPSDGMPMSELAARMGLDVSTISRVVGKMAANGWLEQSPWPNDRRIILVTLTAEGLALLASLVQALEDRTTEIADDLAPEEEEIIGQHMERLAWALWKARS